MNRLRWLGVGFVAFALAAQCGSPSAHAQRRPSPACPFMPNANFPIQWVPVPVVTTKQPTPHGNTATPAKKAPPTTASHPDGKPKETVEHPLVLVEHKYPTTQEQVHHNLHVSVEKSIEFHTSLEKHTEDKVTRYKTLVLTPEAKPGHGDEPGKVVAKTVEMELHTQITSELRRYEEREHTKFRIDMETSTEKKQAERRVLELARMKEPKPRLDKPAEPKLVDKAEPADKPKKSDPAKPETTVGVRWVPVATVQLDFQCGQCHHQSLPKEPLLTVNNPQCSRPTTPGMTAPPNPNRKMTPALFEGAAPSTPLPPIVRGQPVLRQPPSFVPGQFGTTNTPAKSSFWEEETRLSTQPSISFTIPERATDTTPQLFMADSGGRNAPVRPGSATEEAVSLDPIFQAPALPSVVDSLLSAPEYNGSLVEIVLDAPTLPPVKGPWSAVTGQ